MRILGIETSCDDTGIGIISMERDAISVEVQITASQALIHRTYGGVVPEVAAREHTLTILPTIAAALKRGKMRWQDIDAIAVTGGPGLNTALLVGVETARTLSYMLKKPVVRVNHIEGHILSAWAGPGARQIRLPAVALIVSGGHTELIHMNAIGKYTLLGRTVDDAVGEAFDKTAAVLKLPYPGGPEISKRASLGNPEALAFPRAMMKKGSLDFSYSGLKTAVLYHVQKHPPRSATALNNICASFQTAAIEPLVTKAAWALQKTKAKTLILAGGVAANTVLRAALEAEITLNHPRVAYVQAPLELCTDNGVMIAIAGAFAAKRKHFTSWKSLTADPNWELVA